jgi:hypothetical protein
MARLQKWHGQERRASANPAHNCPGCGGWMVQIRRGPYRGFLKCGYGDLDGCCCLDNPAVWMKVNNVNRLGRIKGGR